MKKKTYKISRTMFIYFLIPPFFGLFGVWMSVAFYRAGVVWVAVVFMIVSLAMLIGYLYIDIFDFHLRSFTVDEQGITMHIGFRHWHHDWEQFREAGLVSAWGGDGNVYFVYFSERPLSTVERRVFLQKTRRQLDTVAYFQFGQKRLREILPLLPSELAEPIERQVGLIRPTMNLIERVVNR